MLFPVNLLTSTDNSPVYFTSPSSIWYDDAGLIFSSWAWVSGFSIGFPSSQLFWNRTFGNRQHRSFMDRTSFLTPNQQCQSTEENSKHRRQSMKTTHWTDPYLIHCWPPAGKGTAPCMLDVWYQYTNTTSSSSLPPVMTSTNTRLNKNTFNGLFPRTTWVSRHQKGYTSLDFNDARDDRVAMASAGPHANQLYLAPDE